MIVSPITGQKHNICSKKGREILQKYLKYYISGGATHASSEPVEINWEEVYNPKLHFNSIIDLSIPVPIILADDENTYMNRPKGLSVDMYPEEITSACKIKNNWDYNQ